MADETVEVKAAGIQFYPESGPADEDLYDQILSMWQAERSFLVLSGPPGVGKTRAVEDFVIEMLRSHKAQHDKETCRLSVLFPDYQTKTYSSDDIWKKLQEARVYFVWDICVLHPQYSYEDLIRGVSIGSSTDDKPQLRVREGILGLASRVAEVLEKLSPKSTLPSTILILDEINRAALGQLFGEVIYALDRRGTPVATPHNLPGYGCHIKIPPGLLLFGTMNSVDRAISGFDFALKRRFSTLTLGASKEPVLHRYSSSTAFIINLVSKLYSYFEELVTSATQVGVVPTTELVIGHSYYLAPEKIAAEDEIVRWLAQSIQYQILPALIDYREQGLLDYNQENLESNPFKEYLLGEVPIANLKTNQLEEILKHFSPIQNEDNDG